MAAERESVGKGTSEATAEGEEGSKTEERSKSAARLGLGLGSEFWRRAARAETEGRDLESRLEAMGKGPPLPRNSFHTIVIIDDPLALRCVPLIGLVFGRVWGYSNGFGSGLTDLKRVETCFLG